MGLGELPRTSGRARVEAARGRLALDDLAVRVGDVGLREQRLDEPARRHLGVAVPEGRHAGHDDLGADVGATINIPLVEDTLALAGLVIAGVAIALVQLTGALVIDAVARSA